MDSSGSLNAQVLLLLAERLRAKAVFQVTHGSAHRSIPPVSSMSVSCSRGSGGRCTGHGGGEEGGREASPLAPAAQTQQSKFLTWQFDGEYRGDDYTATLTLGNPDLIGESGEELGQAALYPGRPLAHGGLLVTCLVRGLERKLLGPAG